MECELIFGAEYFLPTLINNQRSTQLSPLCRSVAGYRGVFSLSILLHLLALLYTAFRFPLDTRTPDTG